jgi:hypothetical protein
MMMKQMKMMDGCVRKERILVSSDKIHRNRDKDRASGENERKRVNKGASPLRKIEVKINCNSFKISNNSKKR